MQKKMKIVSLFCLNYTSQPIPPDWSWKAEWQKECDAHAKLVLARLSRQFLPCPPQIKSYIQTVNSRPWKPLCSVFVLRPILWGPVLVTGLLCNTVKQLKTTYFLFCRAGGLGVVGFFCAVTLCVLGMFSSDSEYHPVLLQHHHYWCYLYPQVGA